MARFRDMQKFVKFIKEEHIAMTEGKQTYTFVRNESPDIYWPPANQAKSKYANKEHISESQASDILDDCVVFHYIRFSHTYMFPDDVPLIITAKGRHLLLRLGRWRELAKDNSELLNIATAFIAGIVAACVAGYFSVWVLHHSPPTTVNNYYQTQIRPQAG